MSRDDQCKNRKRMIHSQSGSMNLHFFVQPYLDPAIITPHMNAFCLPSLLRYEFTFSERPEIYMKGQGRIGDAFKLKDQEVAFSATAMISFYAQRAHRAQRAQRAQRTAAPVLSSANRTLMAFFFHFRFSNKTFSHLLVGTSAESHLYIG